MSSLGLKQSPGDFDPPTQQPASGFSTASRVFVSLDSFLFHQRRPSRPRGIGSIERVESSRWEAAVAVPDCEITNQFGKKLVPAMTSLLSSRPPNDLVFRHTHQSIQPSTQTVPVRSPLRPAPRSNRDKERARTKLLDAAKNRDEYDPTLITLPREDRDSSEDDDTSLLTPGLSVSYSSTSWSSASEPAEFSLARPPSRPLFSR